MAEPRRRIRPGSNPGARRREPAGGRVRAVIDAVFPSVDGGRFAAKRTAGQPVRIEAHCFADGHDRLRVVLHWRRIPGDPGGSDADGPQTDHEVDMTPEVNDVWTACFTPAVPGRYRFDVLAWVDPFESWRSEIERRENRSDVRVALRIGAGLAAAMARRADPGDAAVLSTWAALLLETADGPSEIDAKKAVALDVTHATVARRHADRRFAADASRELIVDRRRAQFSSWYELFPRSASHDLTRHGTFRDVEARLPYVAQMGFDVLYFPPIHPIGRVNRKGANNALQSNEGDVGSPWAIGGTEGGHKDILPQLGTLADFRRLCVGARELGMEIALDIAFQCAPDHPYVRQHPEWFRYRPDGSVQYAENPPKKYQDIYPFDFESDNWRGLWDELKSVFVYWIAQGIRIFRVDNPHTKSFAFWEWVIGEIKGVQPDVIFLAEAFTRPKVMHRLAKLGFSQSYTYFTWRTTKRELTDYFTELRSTEGREYFRANLWPNTPDILHETLQSGRRTVFASRLILAATLSANYGIYGPAFELLENAAREAGSEEYKDSEKYQLRAWELDRADSLWPLIARMNRIRRDNAALQSDDSLHFCPIDNDMLLAYTKHDRTSGNVVITVVNLDPSAPQSGWIGLDLASLGIGADEAFQVHDLLSDQRYEWRGPRHYVMLDPRRLPAHVLRVRRHVRSERDFDYFL